MKNRYVVFLIFASLIIFGCSDDDGPTGPSSNPGEWSATVTGEVALEMSGEAVFNSQGFDVVTGTPGLLVTLASVQPDLGLGLFIVFPENSQPGRASFTVGQYDTDSENMFEQQLNSDLVYAQVVLPGTLFFSVSGTIQVTRVATNSFEGTFELTARTTDFENEGERFVEVTGDFAAIGM